MSRTKRRHPDEIYLLRTLLIGSLLVTPLARGSSTDDAKIVAALDTEYQAAVKNNDVATMDRILSDDFVVVLGSGKIYTKAPCFRWRALVGSSTSTRKIRIKPSEFGVIPLTPRQAVVLGKFYWFSVPLTGISISLACSVASIAASRV